jgi:hypothetical protein
MNDSLERDVREVGEERALVLVANRRIEDERAKIGRGAAMLPHVPGLRGRE